MCILDFTTSAIDIVIVVSVSAKSGSCGTGHFLAAVAILEHQAGQLRPGGVDNGEHPSIYDD